jgi:hypothetical protein
MHLKDQNNTQCPRAEVTPWERGARSEEHGARSVERGAGSTELGARLRKAEHHGSPGAQSWELGAWSTEAELGA